MPTQHGPRGDRDRPSREKPVWDERFMRGGLQLSGGAVAEPPDRTPGAKAPPRRAQAKNAAAAAPAKKAATKAAAKKAAAANKGGKGGAAAEG